MKLARQARSRQRRSIVCGARDRGRSAANRRHTGIAQLRGLVGERNRSNAASARSFVCGRARPGRGLRPQNPVARALEPLVGPRAAGVVAGRREDAQTMRPSFAERVGARLAGAIASSTATRRASASAGRHRQGGFGGGLARLDDCASSARAELTRASASRPGLLRRDPAELDRHHRARPGVGAWASAPRAPRAIPRASRDGGDRPCRARTSLHAGRSSRSSRLPRLDAGLGDQRDRLGLARIEHDIARSLGAVKEGLAHAGAGFLAHHGRKLQRPATVVAGARSRRAAVARVQVVGTSSAYRITCASRAASVCVATWVRNFAISCSSSTLPAASTTSVRSTCVSSSAALVSWPSPEAAIPLARAIGDLDLDQVSWMSSTRRGTMADEQVRITNANARREPGITGTPSAGRCQVAPAGLSSRAPAMSIERHPELAWVRRRCRCRRHRGHPRVPPRKRCDAIVLHRHPWGHFAPTRRPDAGCAPCDSDAGPARPCRCAIPLP